MSLVATVADPLTQPAPPGWEEFVAAYGLLPAWDYQLLRTAAWCSQTASSAVLVRDAASREPVAAFHARHPGTTDPRRFIGPGRVPAVSITECRTAPALGPGVAFAAGLDDRGRAEAVRRFERALGARVGGGGGFIAYRALPERDLAAMPSAGRIRLRLSPRMVLHNQWPDLEAYLAALPGKWRNRLRRVRQAVVADGTRAELTRTIEPADACWLSETVNSRYRPRAVPRPPWPAGYFERLNQLPGTRFVTYRSPAGQLLAFVAMYDTGVELVAGAWGNRSETDGGRRHLYFDLYLRQVEWLLSTGRERLVLGCGMTEIKSRYRARPEPTWGVVGLR